MNIAVRFQGDAKCWVERQVKISPLLVNNRPHFYIPRVTRVLPLLVPKLSRQAEACRPVPLLWNANTRPDMRTDDLVSITICIIGEEIKTDFEVLREAMGDLHGLVQRMMRWNNFICNIFLTPKSKIVVEFNEGGSFCHGR